MDISFLKSAFDIPAVKVFTKDGVQSYPQIKRFHSSQHTVANNLDGLLEKEALCRQAAREGACLLKGNLSRPLDAESRAGAVDRTAPTENLILDVDGILLPGVRVETPLDNHRLQELAEAVISELPAPFQNVSYLLHASSSMGMKDHRICLHMDFMLEAPVHPQQLKQYVVYLNHAIPLFEQNLELSASGTALRYPLDRTVVDNTHLIYIANPRFEDGIENPIPNDDDRLFLVRKGRMALDITQELVDYADASKNQRAGQKKINELRAIHGLPKRSEKTSRLSINGHVTHVVTNPESVTMSFAADNGAFVAYNVNGGDSAAYWVHKLNPTVVHNFKGEPNFLFEAADPDTYQWHLDTFIGTNSTKWTQETVQEPARCLPLVFRDEASNAYYNALINADTKDIERIAKTSRDGLEDWMVQFEGVMPANVPIWNYEFNPHNEKRVDFKTRFINKYIPSRYMQGYQPHPDLVPLEIETAHMIAQDCPYIADLILHALGRDLSLFGLFLNWLACALQTRDKLTTAWILQGTQGTGKGVFFDHVLSPLVGYGLDSTQPYAVKVRIENLEDQFNQWVECALFVAFDEFRLSDSPNSRKMFNKIKGMISEKYEPIRGMRENLRNVRSYANYLIFSNDQDVIYLPEGDRRFNVAPRQERKLRSLWDNEGYIIECCIPQELPMFADHMMHFKTNIQIARTAIENDAKKTMREVSRTSIEDFVYAIKNGDLDFFLPILDMPHNAPGAGMVLPAQTIMKQVIRDFDPEFPQRLTLEETRILYLALIGPSDNPKKFGKMLSKYGLESRQMRITGTVKRGFEIPWMLQFNSIEDIQRQYLDTIDYEFQNQRPDNVVRMGTQD